MRALALVLLLGCAQAFAAFAQSGKPMRIIVPFPPGGTADALSRLAAERMAPLLGQQIVVEDRGGAGVKRGRGLVWRARPDGLTLLSSPPHLLTINPLLYKLNFDPAKFVPVGIIATYPNVLVASAKVPAESFDQLIELARANPGKLSIASEGNGTISHLSAEQLKKMAQIDLLHVPYKGTAPALTDLLGGQVDVMFDNLITMMPHVKSGKLKLLGVGGPARIASFPDVPAITERLPGFRSETWMGLVAPPGTSPAIAGRLSAALARVMDDSEVRRRLVDLQAEPAGATPEEMAPRVRQETGRGTEGNRRARSNID